MTVCVWLPLLQGNTAESCSVLSVFLCKAAIQSVSPWPALLHGVIPPLVGDLAFVSLEFHDPVSPFLQPVYVPLSSDHTLCNDSCSPQSGITCSLARSELSLITLIVNNHNKLYCPSLSSWGMPLVRLVSWACYCGLPLLEPSKFFTLSPTQSIVLHLFMENPQPLWSPVPVLNHTHSEDCFPYIQSDLLFLRLLITDFFFLLCTSEMGSIFPINLLSVVVDRN